MGMDCEATVKIGEYPRGGKTRGDDQAADHDMGCKEKSIPFGIADEDDGQLCITFGSSVGTSDFITDSLYEWRNRLPQDGRDGIPLIRIRADNGPESNGQRSRFPERIAEFADYAGMPVRLPYYPPYHSKYDPIGRCRGVLENHRNGTRLADTDTMPEWVASMTWKGLSPIVGISEKICRKGISLSKKAMREAEARLKRNPLLPKWDILTEPV